MHPNSTKHTKTSVYGAMGWIGCVRCKKIPTQLHCTNFCTTSARIAPSFVRQPNGHKCTKIVRNAPKCQFRVQWGGLGAFVVTEFCKATKRSECTQIVRNASKHQFTVQWGGSDEFVAKNSDATSCHKLLHQLGAFCTEFRKATKWS